MARARTIKPGFFQNEEMAEQPAMARLLFIGLLGIADRKGRLEDRPKRIKAQVFPYEECDVEGLVASLAAGGFVQRYEADGLKVIQIVNFTKHQACHPKEPASTLPDPHEPGNAAASNGEPRQAAEGNGMPRQASDGLLAPREGQLKPEDPEDPEVPEDPALEGPEDPEDPGGLELVGVVPDTRGAAKAVTALVALPPHFDPNRACRSSGRFALREFPYVFLRPDEYDGAREQYAKGGLGDDLWREGLKLVNNDLEGKRSQPNVTTLAYKYLTGHTLESLLKRHRLQAAGAVNRPKTATERNLENYRKRYGIEA